MIPNSQADITPPDEPDPPGGHVGEHVRALAKVSSDLAGAKLGAKVSMDALTQLAFVACTADVITWEEARERGRGRCNHVYSTLYSLSGFVGKGKGAAVQSPAAAPGKSSPKIDYGWPTEGADAETCETSVSRGGDRSNN